ncbi:biotin-dependent carboxyltransferase family protein [Breoghania sp.]|uniref:5-oxoprolinase subunit C family protein n=1 Tax=Breoghania sp. TaxID=2065378 RepID=UPI00261F5B3F|nr:biotin-dependent carboxyltransferase family protein [Breoghania sp.]MDJ0930719.1 biotin-dependent carboxyltransferase family protein [Breoghania sp.]
MIEVINPGPMASIQDLGRGGYRSIGVGSAGAMDTRSLRIANRMIGNDDDSARLEFTFGDFELRFTEDIDIAIAGAEADVFVDDVQVPNWWAQTIRKGSRVRAGMSKKGMRIYIAVGGGVDVPLVMGARTCDLKGRFSGLEGRMLQAGDLLQVLRPRLCAAIDGIGVTPEFHPELFATDESGRVLRFIPTAEWDDYDEANQRLFTETDWIVSFYSNRNGCRLEGSQLVPRERRELLSHGILPGTIRLPRPPASPSSSFRRSIRAAAIRSSASSSRSIGTAWRRSLSARRYASRPARSVKPVQPTPRKNT